MFTRKIWCIILFLSINSLMFRLMATGEETGAKGFKIYLIEGRHIDNLSYDYNDEEWPEFIKNSELKKILIDENDIEVYDWPDQEIVLNKETSGELEKIYRENMFNLVEKNFIVTLDGERLYGGVILFAGSARAIDYPVIYLDFKDEHLVLKIRPCHSVATEYRDMAEEKKSIIAIPCVRDYFASLHKLEE